MKLATLKTDSRDGRLIVVNRTLERYTDAPVAWPTMQSALDDWARARDELDAVYRALQTGAVAGRALDMQRLAAPLPRAYQWLDGSAYLNHVERVRKARGAEMPAALLTDPLMYQGGADVMLGCRDAITAGSEDHGIDLEAEVCVVTDDVPAACALTDAARRIQLIGIVNDISLRNLIPAELAKGFGFVHGKPPTAFAPVWATPDELGDAWRDAKVHLPLRTWVNEQPLGAPECGVDMQFDFAQLIAHAAATRPLGAGTIIGSGTISNRDSSRGFCCLAEARMLEIIAHGEPRTEFLKFGDRVTIDMTDADGESIFGAIEQTVTQR
ncbi:MAG: fumarylacetoacetate hydrolase family protein [Gammaproteobacteria bacterium]|nr:fumarylacetoacetate hydrolase family protein [Gammaproteobacteria bacterium]